jgi:IS5 family transposase
MKQQTLAMANGFEQYAKKTRRALFLEEMEQVVPWAQLCRLIEPHYPKAGNGRPPVGLERMLRVYFLQQWFNLSNPGLEEALYDSAVMRQFVASIWGGNRCRTRLRCASFVTCWKNTAWAGRFCRR